MKAGQPLDQLIERLAVGHGDVAADEGTGVGLHADRRAADQRIDQIVVDEQLERLAAAVGNVEGAGDAIGAWVGPENVTRRLIEDQDVVVPDAARRPACPRRR